MKIVTFIPFITFILMTTWEILKKISLQTLPNFELNPWSQGFLSLVFERSIVKKICHFNFIFFWKILSSSKLLKKIRTFRVKIEVIVSQMFPDFKYNPNVLFGRNLAINTPLMYSEQFQQGFFLEGGAAHYGSTTKPWWGTRGERSQKFEGFSTLKSLAFD